MRNLSIRCGAGKTPGQQLPLPQRSSASMSFGWLFLGGMLSSRARLRFTNREQCAVNSVHRSSLLQRTANYLLTVCLTPGGKRNGLLTILKMALSIGIRNSISLLSAIPATRPLTLTLVGLSPTEHTSFFLDTLPEGRISRFRF